MVHIALCEEQPVICRDGNWHDTKDHGTGKIERSESKRRLENPASLKLLYATYHFSPLFSLNNALCLPSTCISRDQSDLVDLTLIHPPAGSAVTRWVRMSVGEDGQALCTRYNGSASCTTNTASGRSGRLFKLSVDRATRRLNWLHLPGCPLFNASQ